MWRRILPENVWLEGVFAYVRNVFYCSLVLAVGSYTHKHPPDFLRGIPLDHYLGYPVIAVGFLLFLLNLAYGLNQILKLKYNSWIKAFLFLVSIYITGWFVMVVWLFRVK